VHDTLLANGIQAGDGPIKQAILRHKTRLKSELQRIKIKRGVKSDLELAQTSDDRTGQNTADRNVHLVNHFHSENPSLRSCQYFDVVDGGSHIILYQTWFSTTRSLCVEVSCAS
jgi:hypothetical protein